MKTDIFLSVNVSLETFSLIILMTQNLNFVPKPVIIL